MKRLACLVVIAWLGACSSSDDGQPKRSPAPARPTHKPVVEDPHELKLPSADRPSLSEQVPIAEDFEDEAARTIDRSNYRDKLKEMYQVIARDAEQLGLAMARPHQQ